MPDNTAEPWWSWAPTFPRKAIISAMVGFNLVAAETIIINLTTAQPPPNSIAEIIATIQTPSVIANFLGLLVGFQLNFEVFHMILSRKANQADVQNAEARGKAQGIAKTQAEVMAWYEANKDDLQNAPPPFSQNNNGHSP